MRNDFSSLSPSSAGFAAVLATRRLALRAIMDGRGADSVILCVPASLAHYGGPEGRRGALLVVTAQVAHLLAGAAGKGGPESGVGGTPQHPPRPPWLAAAELLRRGCALGYEGSCLDADALALLKARLAPARLLDLGPDIARQVASHAGAG